MTIYKMLGYAFGYSSGAIFGMWLEQKLAIGNQTWLIIPNDDPYRLAITCAIVALALRRLPDRVWTRPGRLS